VELSTELPAEVTGKTRSCAGNGSTKAKSNRNDRKTPFDNIYLTSTAFLLN
jgi:hypothetical protein